MQDAESFARRLTGIAASVKSLSVPDELFASREFVAIYEQPQQQLAAALAFARRPAATAHELRVLGYAMQRLPVEPMLVLLNLLAERCERGEIAVGVVESAAFAPLNWGHQALIRQPERPDVQALLQRLTRLPQLPEARRRYIAEQVLTGRARSDYLDYMAAMGRPVPNP